MVIQHTVFFGVNEYVAVSQFGGLIPDLSADRFVRILFEMDVQIGIADHIHNDDCARSDWDFFDKGARTEDPIPAFDAAVIFRIKENQPGGHGVIG